MTRFSVGVDVEVAAAATSKSSVLPVSHSSTHSIAKNVDACCGEYCGAKCQVFSSSSELLNA